MNEKVEQLKALLREAVAHGNHDEDCLHRIFEERFQYLPSEHPHRKKQPECNCWLHRAVQALSEK